MMFAAAASSFSPSFAALLAALFVEHLLKKMKIVIIACL